MKKDSSIVFIASKAADFPSPGNAVYSASKGALMMSIILEKNRRSRDEVDYYLFHQANKFMLNTIRKVCLLPRVKFHINLTETGNTVSSTVLIGLKECLKNGTIKPGNKVMIAGFGVGLSWGGTVLLF